MSSFVWTAFALYSLLIFSGNKMLHFRQSSYFCTVCVVSPGIDRCFLFISAWQRWRSWNSSSIQLNSPNWQVTIIAQIFYFFLIIIDISDQIRNLDTSRTKDEHADRCHVILTSCAILHIILLKNIDVCLRKFILFLFVRRLIPVTEFVMSCKKAEDLLMPTLMPTQTVLVSK